MVDLPWYARSFEAARSKAVRQDVDATPTEVLALKRRSGRVQKAEQQACQHDDSSTTQELPLK
jgi:hypothetical protein